MSDKNFILQCKCGWKELSTGISTHLSHLKEVKNNNCKKCGGPRIFYCPQCRSKVKMFRFKGVK